MRVSYGVSFVSTTHWGRVTHICVSKLFSIGSENGLSLGRRQAIIWSNVAMLLIGSLRKKWWNLNKNSNIFIEENACQNFVCKMAAILPWPQCVKVVFGFYFSYCIIFDIGQCYNMGAIAMQDYHLAHILNSNLQNLVMISYLSVTQWFEIWHKARQWYSRALCNMSKILGKLTECYWQTRYIVV